MKFGLKEKEIQEIKEVVSKFREIETVIIFGSRAMNTNKKGADIDLALKGNISLDVLAKVKMILEEDTKLPYFFDVIDYSSINNPDLKKHIDEKGEVFYEK